jgi:hypothetical protein
MAKIIYQEDEHERLKIIFGTITSEDSLFLYITTEDNTAFRINKKNIVSVKE